MTTRSGMRMMPGLALLALTAGGWLVGCGPAGDGGLHAAAAQSTLGAADGQGDRPDYECELVLRAVGRIDTGPGYATSCDLGLADGGPCRYVWQGRIDVAEQAAERFTSIEVLYRTGQTGDQWYAVAAAPAGAPSDGFAPYEFRILEHTPAAGMSMTSLNRTVIELVPYGVEPDGTRVFDHNRVADPLDAYRLDLDNLWSIDEAPGVCSPDDQPVPSWTFAYPGWGQHIADGPLLAGGQVRIAYDGRRLRETQACMGSEGPVSATTIHAAWSFDGGPVHSAQVEHYVESFGYACQGEESPCIEQQVDQPLLAVPAAAAEMQLWFYCVPGFSAGAEANWRYDSNLGDNYRAAVVAQAAPVHWAGAWQQRAARSGFTFALPEPLLYAGFSNMGWSVQAQVYVRGLTDQHRVDGQRLRAYVETDLLGCAPGGALELAELPLAEAQAGPYGNNALFRWGYEALAGHCPPGSYHYRFLFSADGGLTHTPLGAAASTDQPDATALRTLIVE